MKKNLFLRVFLSLVLMVPFPTRVQAAQTLPPATPINPSLILPKYAIHLLDDSDPNSDNILQKSSASKINDQGFVSGSATFFIPTPPVLPASGTINQYGYFERAVIWDTRNSYLPINLGAFPNGPRSASAGINNRNDIVGFGLAAGTINGELAFYYSSSSGSYQLPIYNGSEMAVSINDQREIVGSSTTLFSWMNTEAVLWKNGTVIGLGTLPGAFYSKAYDINNTGDIIGVAYNGIRFDAVLWDKLGAIKKLAGPSAVDNCSGSSVNDHKEAVGQCGNPYKAVYWDAQGNVSILGTVSGGSNIIALEINNLGYIVGSYGFGNNAKAFLYHNSFGMIDLNNQIPQNSGWVLQRASSINNQGQIVGTGKYHGIQHGFILDPCNGNCAECSDGVDNDGDAQADFPNDQGCVSAQDLSESNCGDSICASGENAMICPLDCAQCTDGIDNDGDGNVDFPSDSGCIASTDNQEASCGDGFCDADEFISCHNDCGPVYPAGWLIFATETKVNGAIGSTPQNALGNADRICNQEANQRGYPGRYKAWLSNSTVNAVNRVADGQFYNVFSNIVANNLLPGQLGGLLGSVLSSPVNQSSSDTAWTGTFMIAGVNYPGHNCNDWTSSSSSVNGLYGQVNSPFVGHWTHWADSQCSEMKSIYCFQVQ